MCLNLGVLGVLGIFVSLFGGFLRVLLLLFGFCFFFLNTIQKLAKKKKEKDYSTNDKPYGLSPTKEGIFIKLLP